MSSCPAKRRAAAVAGHQRQRRGEPAAGAAADEHDPLRVDAQLLGVLGGPGQARVAVLDRAGVRGLRRQPVLDRDHGAPTLLGEVEHLPEPVPGVPPIMPPPCV